MTAEYLTTAEVATLLRVRPKTLWNWHNQRKGPPVTKVGAKSLYEVKALRRYLDANTMGELVR